MSKTPLDATTLKQELKSGKSLAQIAAAQGITQSDLINRLQAVIEKNIDQAVTDKKLTAEKADQLKKLNSKVNNLGDKNLLIQILFLDTYK